MSGGPVRRQGVTGRNPVRGAVAVLQGHRDLSRRTRAANPAGSPSAAAGRRPPGTFTPTTARPSARARSSVPARRPGPGASAFRGVRGVQGQHRRRAVAGQRQLRSGRREPSSRTPDGRVLLGAAQAAVARRPGTRTARRPGSPPGRPANGPRTRPGRSPACPWRRPGPAAAPGPRRAAGGGSNCQPASAAASPRPPAARRSASRAAGGSSRSVRTVPASSASAGAATSSGSMPRAPARSPLSAPHRIGLPVELPVRHRRDHQQPDVGARAQRRRAAPGPGRAARTRRRQRGQRHRERAAQRHRRPPPATPRRPPPRRPAAARSGPARPARPAAGSAGPASSGAHDGGGQRQQQRLDRGEPRDPAARTAARPQQSASRRARSVLSSRATSSSA